MGSEVIKARRREWSADDKAGLRMSIQHNFGLVAYKTNFPMRTREAFNPTKHFSKQALHPQTYGLPTLTFLVINAQTEHSDVTAHSTAFEKCCRSGIRPNNTSVPSMNGSEEFPMIEAMSSNCLCVV